MVIANISNQGFRLLLEDEELFVRFAEFPWFKDVPAEKLAKVERPQPHHLRWPDLDIDLAIDSIRDPAKFPLIAKAK